MSNPRRELHLTEKIEGGMYHLLYLNEKGVECTLYSGLDAFQRACSHMKFIMGTWSEK